VPAIIVFKTKLKFAGISEALFFALCMSLCFCAIGCKRQRTGKLTLAQVHQVTQELAKAASDAAPNGTLIKTRRARNGIAGGGADELYIGLHGNTAARDKLLQKLEGVATLHRLTVDGPAPNGNSSRITLRSAGIATHHIEMEILR